MAEEGEKHRHNIANLINPDKFVGYQPNGSNPFSVWYQENIDGFPDRKRMLVETNPDLAQRVFSVFGDETIGRYFVSAYASHPLYAATARHIKRELMRQSWGELPIVRKVPNHKVYKTRVYKIKKKGMNRQQRK